MMGHNRWTKVTLVSFPSNPVLVNLGNLSPILGRNFATLYQLCLMICSLRNSWYDGIQYLDQTNVSQFTQKIPFQVRSIDQLIDN